MNILSRTIQTIKKKFFGHRKTEKVGNSRELQFDEYELFRRVVETSTVSLDIHYPEYIASNLHSADEVVQKVKELIGGQSHGSYFDASIKRYAHYFAVAMGLPLGREVLDVGNSPGHVGIGLDLLGHKVTGINLNSEWRKLYPSSEWLTKFNVIECNIENEPLPYESNYFDAVYFTEVLEHIAITSPEKVCREIYRVLKPGCVLVLSTPNICNIANLYALTKNFNIFWPPEIFYESLDRHNREYTPDEVGGLLRNAGFQKIVMYGFNCDSNWRAGGNEFAYSFLTKYGDGYPMLRNTIMALSWKPL